MASPIRDMVKEVPSPPIGKRAIVVTLRFHTDGIADQANHIVPGFCYESGFVNVLKEDNSAHGIKQKQSIVFDRLDQLPNAVAQALDEAGVFVVRNRSPKRKH